MCHIGTNHRHIAIVLLLLLLLLPVLGRGRGRGRLGRRTGLGFLFLGWDEVLGGGWRVRPLLADGGLERVHVHLGLPDVCRGEKT